jgi:tRNA U34 5-carboxymethylaminomethyl modifying enzyme MnmG/GidA
MGFFADLVHVKADKESNQLRLSIRMSEEALLEYWLQPSDVKDFIDAQDYTEWRGSDNFKARIKNRGASVGIKTSEGMTYVKMSESHVWLLRAKVEAAYFELDPNAKEASLQGMPSHITLDIIARMQNEFQMSMLKTVSDMIDDKFASLTHQLTKQLQNIQVVSTTSPQQNTYKVPKDEPIFIPSDITSDQLSGVANVQETEAQEDVSDALAALRKLKKGV